MHARLAGVYAGQGATRSKGRHCYSFHWSTERVKQLVDRAHGIKHARDKYSPALHQQKISRLAQGVHAIKKKRTRIRLKTVGYMLCIRYNIVSSPDI